MTALRGEKSCPPPVDWPRGIANTRAGKAATLVAATRKEDCGEARRKKRSARGNSADNTQRSARARRGRSGRPRCEALPVCRRPQAGDTISREPDDAAFGRNDARRWPGTDARRNSAGFGGGGLLQPSQPRRMAARTARTFSAMSGAPTSSETSAQHVAPRRVTSAMLCSLMPPMATKGRRMLATTHSR